MAGCDSTARAWRSDATDRIDDAVAPVPAAAVARELAGSGSASRPALEVAPWSPPSQSPRPAPQPDSWVAPTLTASFAVGWLLTLAALGTFTAVWLVGMIATTVFLILGQGKLVPVLVFGATGVLLGRGWAGMVQTIRGRLQKRDLTEPPALPDRFWALSVPLQRMVRDARSLRIALSDPQTTLPEIDREMFEWIASMTRLPAPDLRRLAERGITPDGLRAELVQSRWWADRAEPAWPGRRPRWPGPDHRTRALALLERFERDAIGSHDDPFRG